MENTYCITTAIIYEIPINDYECVKKFIVEAESYAKEHEKDDMWLQKSLDTINRGLKVMFLYLWDTDELKFIGEHGSEYRQNNSIQEGSRAVIRTCPPSFA